MLNSSQQLHLLSSAQHADKLLAEVESDSLRVEVEIRVPQVQEFAFAGANKSCRGLRRPHPNPDGAGSRSQGIPLPEPDFESVHSIRVTLAFIRIAFQECTPDRMRGYGELPEDEVRELNGLVDEMVSAVEKLDAYLRQGLGTGFGSAAGALAQSGADVGPGEDSGADRQRTRLRRIPSHALDDCRSVGVEELRDRPVRAGELREIVLAESYRADGYLASGREPDHRGAHAAGLWRHAASDGLVRGPQRRTNRSGAIAGIRERAAQPGKLQARYPHRRGTSVGAAAGRHCAGGYAGPGFAGYFGRSGDAGVFASLRSWSGADRRGIDAD